MSNFTAIRTYNDLLTTFV